jgi:hypothetical protein
MPSTTAVHKKKRPTPRPTGSTRAVAAPPLTAPFRFKDAEVDAVADTVAELAAVADAVAELLADLLHSVDVPVEEPEEVRVYLDDRVTLDDGVYLAEAVAVAAAEDICPVKGKRGGFKFQVHTASPEAMLSDASGDAPPLPPPSMLFSAAFSAYRALPPKGKPQPHEWTVLAAFVAEAPEGGGALRCASLATGTKCVGMSGMCARGLVVNDCHAEVLARRALQRALLLEAAAHARHCGGGGCALPPAGCLLAHGEGARAPLLRLRAGVRLHLCITDAPCGEAHEYGDGGDGNGSRRTGAKPVVALAAPAGVGGGGGSGHPPLRTKSGRSDLPLHRRTRSLCCSDKVARWVGVGAQGALLAALLCAPLPLASVSVWAGGGAGVDAAVAAGEALRRALAGPRAAPCHAAARAAALRACGEGDAAARALGGAALRAEGGGAGGAPPPFEHGPARAPPAAPPAAGGGRKRGRADGAPELVSSPLSLAAFAAAPAPGMPPPPLLAEALLGVTGRLMGSTAGTDPLRAASALCKARAGAEWARVALGAAAAARPLTYAAAKEGQGAPPLSYARAHREVTRAWMDAEGGAFAGWPRCDRAAWEDFAIV